MKIAISAETMCDLSPELIKKYNIHLVASGVVLGDEHRQDGEVTPAEIFSFVTKTKKLPKTNAVNETQFHEHFSALLKNYDAVVHFSISNHFSTTIVQAKAAAEKLSNVFVVDSLSLSTGIGLLALWGAQEIERNSNITPEEIHKKANSLAPKIQASFVIERLDYLYKGGRCNGLQLLGANIFGLKPQIFLKDGKMNVGKKFRGKMDQVVKQYCEDIIQKNPEPDLTNAFVTYTTATPEMINEAKTALKKLGFKNIYESTAGGTITCHCGEHTLGILYINK
ncbi:MAG: DegV family EDD domain-containing protein [Christensenellaceae bacterium]|nr:DegV family EDD domain-containing protein [Christensenellaceae bacterium]